MHRGGVGFARYVKLCYNRDTPPKYTRWHTRNKIMKKTKEVILDWTADLLPMWEDPLSKDAQPITLKPLKQPAEREQALTLPEDNYEEDA